MSLTKLALALMLAFFWHSCVSPRFPGNNDIEVTWELMSNFKYEEPIASAQFVISNNSKFTLTDSNWALYFNQTPRDITNDFAETQKIIVEHLSGDWHRIIPRPGFELAPGNKVVVNYEAKYWWLKESDAPSGLYIVFESGQGTEEIVEVRNFTVLPFERPEQLARHFADEYPLPTPENLFQQNEEMGLSQLPHHQFLKVIPTPKSIIPSGQNFSLSKKSKINYNHEDLNFEANYLQKQIKELTGLNLESILSENHQENSIFLNIKTKNDWNPDYYSLEVGGPNVIIEAAHPRGIFYGVQSLLALLPVNMDIRKTETLVLPGVKIRDEPRFDYRGLHIDVARNFTPKETIMKAVDVMSFYKLNILHLHLTDDEGWRLEIPGLPELTSVGGQRGHTTKDAAALHPAYGSGPKPISQYFSRQDFIEILEYAHKRHVKVIPEINLPGHCRAAIKAMEARYEYYMGKGNPMAANEFRLIDPNDKSVYLSAQHFNDNVANVALESVYVFFEKVVDEIISMYNDAGAPLEVLHVGGDEVPKGAWTKSQIIDELMKRMPDIKHHENMHAYFSERVLEILTTKGLKMAGWEEIALHKNNGMEVNPSFANGKVIPYLWNNLWHGHDLAYRFANRGYPVVLCHVTNLYFDLAYGNHPAEPGLYWGGFVNVFDAWHYTPYNIFSTTLKNNMGRKLDPKVDFAGMERLNPDARSKILGIQAQLWSETIRSCQMLEYYLLPKLIGMAESAWAQQRLWEDAEPGLERDIMVKESWNIFANTIAQRELPRLSRLFGGFNYRVPPPEAKIEDGMLFANIELPGLTIRYTTDGAEPTIDSEVYKNKVEVGNNSIKVKAFDSAGRSSRTIEMRNVE